MPAREDRQRRGDARGHGEEAEAEVEAHRGADVGHGRGGDVDHAERAAAQPVVSDGNRLGAGGGVIYGAQEPSDIGLDPPFTSPGTAVAARGASTIERAAASGKGSAAGG